MQVANSLCIGDLSKINEMTYFDHPYCSNSTLTALGQELGLLPEFGGDKENAYRMGSLFDAVVTEAHKIDLIQNKIIDSDYFFSQAEYDQCKKMKSNLELNPIYKTFLLQNPDFQKEVYVEDFEFDGFKLNMRAKLDYFITGMVADLKSTACTSQKSFENACIQFGYYRQMWLYCKLTGAKRAIIFGVSKSKPHNVFVVRILENDENWKLGEREITKLAYKYYMLKN